MNQKSSNVLAVQVLLTVTALEFFGPPVRDIGGSHALNPTWVGHARVHLIWLLGFMLTSGIANVYLIWFRRPFELRNLWLSAAWQCCNMAGFWAAFFFAPMYGGEMTMEGVHMHILGLDENVFVFTVLTILLAAGLGLLSRIPPHTIPTEQQHEAR
ncbi:MAG: hypothetical protein E4H03_01210 [Myxococcales bacterium]|nr:MAG: hypothetical protein E4H03_01210 [Myxococcales bacterium]